MSALKLLLSNINMILIYCLAGLLPLFFTPLTSEYYDTAKFLLISLSVLVMLMIWGVRLITENRLVLVKTPLDLLMLLYLLVVVISTIFSSSPYNSLYGLLPKVQGGLLSQVAIVLLYFMVVSNVKTAKQTITTLQLLTISGLVMSIVSLLSYFKLFLPFKAAQFTTFSLAGTPAVTGILLAILLPLALTQLLATSHSKSALKNPVTIFYALACLVFIITIVLIGNMAAWIGALVAIGLTLYVHLTSEEKRFRLSGLTSSLLAIIGLIALLLATLTYTPTLKDSTLLGKLGAEFNKTREPQMPLSTSWKVSTSAFGDSPILGTGPATYLYNFTQYKPVSYNLTPSWNLRLNAAHNQYLQTWAELGGAGILLLLLICSTFCVFALKHKDAWGLSIAGITFFVTMALFPTSVLTQAVGFMIIALFMVASIGRNKVTEMVVDFSGKTLSGNSGTHFLLPTLLFVPILIVVFVSLVYPGFITKLVAGEYYQRQALNNLSTNKIIEARASLIKAISRNPEVDSYQVGLAQVNFTIANLIAASKGPTEASPSGSLTDKDKTDIQQLLQQSIAGGRASTVLAPRSAGNWEILASIYRQISGVAKDATAFSLDAYGKAIQRDPYNPLLRLAVGGVYYQAKNYDLAIRFFDDAVSLKPDYPNALYNLAIALRDKGTDASIAEATSVAERLVSQLQDKPNSEDYKVASKLLADLKAAAPATNQPPAATPSAALENKDLPKVLDEKDLGDKPENVSTPAAVQKNP